MSEFEVLGGYLDVNVAVDAGVEVARSWAELVLVLASIDES